MNQYKRRTYHKFAEFLSDFKYVSSRRKQVRQLMRGESIDASFRERLQLAVTAVNDCRYCSFVHARLALEHGVPEDEIQALRQGMLEESPADQIPALLYAQHWAECNTHPDPQLRQQIVQRYGQETTLQIELIMHLIRTANLVGNTFDYILYRLSFGHWGANRSMRAS